MFLGEYQTRFSGKGRVILPHKIRCELKGNVVVLSKGFESCIWGFDLTDFEKEAIKQLEISATEERARYMRRYLFSSSQSVGLDAQGRIIIPSTLLDFASVGGDVVIVGAGDHFEIWDVKFWKKHISEVEAKLGRVS